MEEKLIYFAFSEMAASKYGYHIATFKDGSHLKYTSIAENPDYFNRTYTFPDKQFLGSKKASDMLSYEHSDNLQPSYDVNNDKNNSHNTNTQEQKSSQTSYTIFEDEPVNPFVIVEKIKQLREPDNKDNAQNYPSQKKN